MNDNELLFVQFLKGDTKSFETLFKLFYAPLCTYAYKYVRDYDEAEDLVQGFFAKIWDSKSSISINTSVKNYFFRSVRNPFLPLVCNEWLTLSRLWRGFWKYLRIVNYLISLIRIPGGLNVNHHRQNNGKWFSLSCMWQKLKNYYYFVV